MITYGKNSKRKWVLLLLITRGGAGEGGRESVHWDV